MTQIVRLKDEIILKKMQIANTFVSRVIGLMFKKEHPNFDGLLIEPCNSIHTCFMRYSIDVVFLNDKNLVIKIIRDIKPWRMTWFYYKATKVLEFPSGMVTLDIKLGDELSFE